MEVMAALEELRVITTHDDNLEKQYKESELVIFIVWMYYVYQLNFPTTVMIQLWQRIQSCKWSLIELGEK